jgi:hypothetical protein
MAACLIPNPNIDWDNIVEWMCKLRGKSLHVILCKLCLAATVYHIWQLRNDLCHSNTPRTEKALVAQIKWEVRARVMYRKKFKCSPISVKLSKLWRM